MSRKSTKEPKPARAASVPPKGSFGLVAGGAVLALVFLIGLFAYTRQASPPPAAPVAQAAPPALTEVPEINRRAHPQAAQPPLRFPAYAMSRPVEVVRAAYKFAAEHPEVLSYMPCFCGCERHGHRGNEDCFVLSRDINGNVIEWNDHGMECAVCLDVATKSAQLFASGASVKVIRETIDKEMGVKATNHTPTPHPPHN